MMRFANIQFNDRRDHRQIFLNSTVETNDDANAADAGVSSVIVCMSQAMGVREPVLHWLRTGKERTGAYGSIVSRR